MLHGSVIRTDRIHEITDENRKYREPRIRNMRRSTPTQAQPSRIDGFAMGYLPGETAAAWAFMEPMLCGLEVLYQEPEAQNGFVRSTHGRVARVEFIYYHDDASKSYLKGAAVFDNRGKALFFVPGATLGYVGAGPGLSEQMLITLGVSKELFDEINQSVNGQYDSVIVSREKFDRVENGPYVETLLVSRTWQWWIA